MPYLSNKNGTLTLFILQNMTNLELKEMIIRMDEKIDHIIAHLEDLNGRIGKAEKEISTIQMWKAELKGNWTAVSIIGSVIGALIGFWIALLVTK